MIVSKKCQRGFKKLLKRCQRDRERGVKQVSKRRQRDVKEVSKKSQRRVKEVSTRCQAVLLTMCTTVVVDMGRTLFAKNVYHPRGAHQGWLRRHGEQVDGLHFHSTEVLLSDLGKDFLSLGLLEGHSLFHTPH